MSLLGILYVASGTPLMVHLAVLQASGEQTVRRDVARDAAGLHGGAERRRGARPVGQRHRRSRGAGGRAAQHPRRLRGQCTVGDRERVSGGGGGERWRLILPQSSR